MSTKQAGAIIWIIYYILKLDNQTNHCFTPGFISEQYNELLKEFTHKKAIANLLEFKKHGDKKQMTTLEEGAKLRVWLNKHTDRKGITWFEKQSGNYKLKTEYVESLKDMMR